MPDAARMRPISADFKLYDAFMDVRNKTTYVNERAYISEQAEKQIRRSMLGFLKM